MASWLARFTAARRLARELKATRNELHELRVAAQSIAKSLETYVRAAYGPETPAASVEGALEVTYVDSQQQAEWMDIETRLTTAKGIPPTEEEVMAEFERRHPDLPFGGDRRGTA